MTDPRSVFRLEILAEWLTHQGFHVKDMGLLASAIERPWLQFNGRDLYPDMWRKAAALLDSIESSHPLHDGNKRVGVLLTLLFLRSYGVPDTAIDDDDLFELVCDVASKHLEVSEIASRSQRITEH